MNLKATTVYMDESGNTGHNLIDPNQRVFTLAGCIYSKDQAQKLLALVDSKSQKEVHFKNLKRRKSGQDSVVKLMNDYLINEDFVKVDVIHKNYMVTTKIVDILIEHLLYTQGIDLYLNGRNIALANMMFYCMPSFCGEDKVVAMYKSFIAMIKEQSAKSVIMFYSDIQLLIDSCSNDKFKEDLNLLISTRSVIDDVLSGSDKSSLDPSIPAVFSQCVSWGEAYPSGFHVIHDDSHSIEEQQVLFSQFMDWTQDEIEIGYDRRKFELPLKGKSLNFSKSESYLQLQVADIIASSIAYWINGLLRNEKEDYLFLELNKLKLNKLISQNIIWPSKEVSPEELNTVHDGGLNPADFTALFLANNK